MRVHPAASEMCWALPLLLLQMGQMLLLGCYPAAASSAAATPAATATTHRYNYA